MLSSIILGWFPSFNHPSFTFNSPSLIISRPDGGLPGFIDLIVFCSWARGLDKGKLYSNRIKTRPQYIHEKFDSKMSGIANVFHVRKYMTAFRSPPWGHLGYSCGVVSVQRSLQWMLWCRSLITEVKTDRTLGRHIALVFYCHLLSCGYLWMFFRVCDLDVRNNKIKIWWVHEKHGNMVLMIW